MDSFAGTAQGCSLIAPIGRPCRAQACRDEEAKSAAQRSHARRRGGGSAPAAELHARAAERQDAAQALQLVPKQAVGVLDLLLSARVLRRRQRGAQGKVLPGRHCGMKRASGLLANTGQLKERELQSRGGGNQLTGSWCGRCWQGRGRLQGCWHRGQRGELDEA
jgi:hypothetical protein